MAVSAVIPAIYDVLNCPDSVVVWGGIVIGPFAPEVITKPPPGALLGLPAGVLCAVPDEAWELAPGITIAFPGYIAFMIE